MALLLNSDIEQKIKLHICGKIARIGGSVNQLMDYQKCTVEDINLVDGGYGIVRSMNGIRSPLQMLKVIQRYLSQERKFLLHGYAVPRDRKTISLDIHNAHEVPALARRFDAAISSNMIEHSPNPIFLLLNLYLITKIGGFQYHAIPHYRYTFDVHRAPTPFEHMLEDFENKMDALDTSHHADYVQSAIEKHGWQRSFHEKYPVAYPYMHFHVFDEYNVKQLFELMFEDVVSDVFKTEEYSDNVVICRNVLNKDFISRYGSLIESYSKGFLAEI